MTRLEARARLFACLLAALAGYVDAIGFIRTGGFFVSFMSGNSTRLGVGLAAALQDALIAGGLILSFLLGVVGGSLLGQVASDRRRPAIVLGLVAALLCGAAILDSVAIASIALLAIAMGAENTVLERNGETRFGVTYMTGSLVRVGSGIAAALLGRSGSGWLGYLLLWAGFVVGAALGALANTSAAQICLWVASLAALLLAIASLRLLR